MQSKVIITIVQTAVGGQTPTTLWTPHSKGPGKDPRAACQPSRHLSGANVEEIRSLAAGARPGNIHKDGWTLTTRSRLDFFMDHRPRSAFLLSRRHRGARRQNHQRGRSAARVYQVRARLAHRLCCVRPCGSSRMFPHPSYRRLSSHNCEKGEPKAAGAVPQFDANSAAAAFYRIRVLVGPTGRAEIGLVTDVREACCVGSFVCWGRVRPECETRAVLNTRALGSILW